MKKYMQRLGTRGILAFSLVLLVCCSTYAQLPTATILGTVKDSTGGAVAGAMVVVTNTDTASTRTTTTGDDGSYRFPALAVGNYTVTVSKEGFSTFERAGLTLVVEQNATIDVTMQVGSTSQNVVVTGEAPLIDTTSSTAGQLVSDTTLTNLPLNGRNYTDLTLLQVGVTQISSAQSFGGNVGTLGDNGTNLTSNGGSQRSNAYLLDGAFQGGAMGLSPDSVTGSALGVDGIKEYKVVSVLPSAEYGLAMGAQVTTVSKGGTNQFHGDAFDYLRNNVADAQVYNVTEDVLNLNGCGTADTLAFPCHKTAPFQRNNFGGSFGGPIQKDKTFFYAVFEGIEQRQGIVTTETTLPAACFVTTAGVPLTVLANGLPQLPGGGPVTSPSQVMVPKVIKNDGCVSGSSANPITSNPFINALAQFYPVPNVPLTSATNTFNFESAYDQPTDEQYGQIRVDHVFSANDSIFFRYTHDDAHTNAQAGSDPREQDNDVSSETFATLSETHIFTPTLLNTFRVSISRNNQNLFMSYPQTFPDSANPLLPNEPQFQPGVTAWVLGTGNFYQVPGQASPGASPQLCNGTLTQTAVVPATTPATFNYSCTGTGAVLSQYGSITGNEGQNNPGTVDNDVYTISDDVFWTKGKHAFKFGFLGNRFDQPVWLISTPSGTASFSAGNIANGGPCVASTVGANANQCPLAAYFDGVYNTISASTPGSNFIRQFRFYTYGFYAQDDFKILSHLTLNLGLRYEFATTDTERLPGLAFSLRNPALDTVGTAGPMTDNPSLHNFGPRIGFAWDVFGNGKTSLRGGAALLYDVGSWYGQLEMSNSISTLTNTGAYLGAVFTFSNPDPIYTGSSGVGTGAKGCCSVPIQQVNSSGVVNGPGTLSPYSPSVPFSVPLNNGVQDAVPGPRTAQYNMRQPSMLQRALGIDQALPWNMALSVQYVGTRAWHLMQERDGDPEGYYATTPGTPAGGLSGQIGSCVPSAVNPTPVNPQCTAVVYSTNPTTLPFYCSPADGTPGAPTAAHPCSATATLLNCETTFNFAGAVPTCPGKVNPAFNGLQTYVSSGGDSYYNSLQVVLNKRTSKGLNFNIGYTWQKLISNGVGEANGEVGSVDTHEFPISGPQSIIDRGPSQFNATHQIRASAVYTVPNFAKPESLLGKFIDGWGFSPIVSMQTGYPLTLTFSGDRILISAGEEVERPSLCPSYSAAAFKSSATYTGDRHTSTFFNTSMICLQPAGTFGTTPVGFFSGPGLVNMNAAFTKDTKVRWLGEAGTVQFRFELFNAINHPNFTAPILSMFSVPSGSPSECPSGGSIAQLTAPGTGCSSVPSSTAGRDSLTTLTPMRQIEFAVKFIF